MATKPLSMKQRVEALEDARAKAVLGGGEARLEKQRSSGKLTARDRIDALVPDRDDVGLAVRSRDLDRAPEPFDRVIELHDGQSDLLVLGRARREHGAHPWQAQPLADADLAEYRIRLRPTHLESAIREAPQSISALRRITRDRDRVQQLRPDRTPRPLDHELEPQRVHDLLGQVPQMLRKLRSLRRLTIQPGPVPVHQRGEPVTNLFRAGLGQCVHGQHRARDRPCLRLRSLRYWQPRRPHRRRPPCPRLRPPVHRAGPPDRELQPARDRVGPGRPGTIG